MLRTSELIIKSKLEELYKLEEFIEQISDMYNVNGNYYSNMLVTLSEAVTNSIVHAHKENPELDVHISFESKNKGLYFSVSDQGEGFDFDTYPDPTDISVENFEELGTGLYLMKKLSDTITYDKAERKVEFGFKISSINKELAVSRAASLQEYFQTNKKLVKAH